MSAIHHLHHFFIRHGKTIYCFMADMAIITGLVWLCLIFARWLTYTFPHLVNWK
jgi:uncharacterized RDD family membrane protein YckC